MSFTSMIIKENMPDLQLSSRKQHMNNRTRTGEQGEGGGGRETKRVTYCKGCLLCTKSRQVHFHGEISPVLFCFYQLPSLEPQEENV